MIEELEDKSTGVICLHCGAHIPLPNSRIRGSSGRISNDSNRRLLIVRCCECGKEAPYLAIEITALKRKPKAIGSAA
jgi:RNase P subunit RPR2